MAVETVFGHAFMGTYQNEGPTQPVQATIQVITEATAPVPSPEDQLNSTLARFWELEEPTPLPPAFTPEETRVQREYALTHAFIPLAGKYHL